MENRSSSHPDILGGYVFPLHALIVSDNLTGWFAKLSSSFLSQRAAKLLVLAGAESLDKDLMIGQMQGKYQLSVFQDVGHNLQQDAPERLANLLVEFWRRNEQGRDQRKILKNVKKVGQA